MTRSHSSPLRAAAVVALSCVAASFVPARPIRAQEEDTLRLTLEEAALMAARRNAAVAVAGQRIRQAQARVTQSRAALLPTLDAFASHGARTFNTASFGLDFPTLPGQPPFFDPEGQVEGPVTTIDTGARVSMTVFAWSRIERLRSMRLSATAASSDREGVSVDAASQGAMAYVRAARAEALLRVRRADLALADSLLTIARDLIHAGVGVALDETRAEAQVAQVRARIIGDRNAVAQAHLLLGRALGIPTGTPVSLLDTLGSSTGPPHFDVPTLVSDAISHRKEIEALDTRVTAQRRMIRAVRSESYPSLRAVVSDALSGKKYGHLLNTYNWSLAISVPVFDGMRRSARTQEQEAALRELEIRRDDLVDGIEVEVRRGLLDLGSAREQVGATRTRLSLAELQLRQARDRFEAGVTGNADVVTSSLALSSTRADLVNAMAALEVARIRLARSRGRIIGAEDNDIG